MARVTLEFWDTRVILQRVQLGEPLGPAGARTGLMNVYEAVCNTMLVSGAEAAKEMLRGLATDFEELTPRRILAASELRVREKHRKLSYADAAGYVSARELKAVFVTTDKAFRGLAGVQIIERVEPA